MEIYGLLKTTLLDYPGHVAATVFLGGCNFRCPFCHNKEVVFRQDKTSPSPKEAFSQHPPSSPAISEEAFFAFLQKRQNVLEGVCITGGEPTLSPRLADFLRRIKSLGFLVKLDTNGYCPEALSALLHEGLLDYVAMDIKGTLPRYPEICGLASFDAEKIVASVQLLKDCQIPSEFRTTTAKELQAPEDFSAIGQWLSGARAYYLQSYRDCETLSGKHFTPYPEKELREIAEQLKAWVPNTFLRGVSDMDA